MTSGLLDIFHARTGVVCCVGAGGKKTTMFRLAEEHMGRVGITATAHIEYFPKTLPAIKYIAEQSELLKQLEADEHSKLIAFAQPSQRRGRRAGVSLESIKQFREAGRFDLLLIKADGARGRWIKAPADHEPPIPECVDTVIPVISAKAIGKRLTDRIAHRVGMVSAIAGIRENEKIEPHHVARLLASNKGSLKNAGSARIIPLINMVDDTEREKLARLAAMEAIGMTDRFDCIILAAMREKEPVVDIVLKQ